MLNFLYIFIIFNKFYLFYSRDTSTAKPQLIERLVDDRSESSLSYYEFLQHIRTQVK